MAVKKHDTIRAQCGPFAMVPIWLLERCQDSAAIHLYALLGKWANRERRAWPKSDELAAWMGVSLRSIERTIATLRKHGALKTARRRRPDGAVVGLDFLLVQIEPVADQVDEQPATCGGLQAVHSATGVAAIPPPVAVISISELDPKNQIQEQDLSAAPTSGSQKRTLLDDYHDAFVAAFTGKKPLIHGPKDGKLLKTLADQFGEDLVRTLLGWFFEIRDPFIHNTGYSVGVFYTCWNKLHLTYRPPIASADTSHQVVDDMRARSEARQVQLEAEARAVLVAASETEGQALKHLVLVDFEHDYPRLRERMRADAFAHAVKTAMVQRLVHTARRQQTTPADALAQILREPAA